MDFDVSMGEYNVAQELRMEKLRVALELDAVSAAAYRRATGMDVESLLAYQDALVRMYEDQQRRLVENPWMIDPTQEVPF